MIERHVTQNMTKALEKKVEIISLNWDMTASLCAVSSSVFSYLTVIRCGIISAAGSVVN